MALTDENSAAEKRREALRHPIRWFNHTKEGEIPRRELAGITGATVGQSMMFGMAGANWFFHFCTNVLMLKDTTVGKMTSAAAILDAVIDPVVGVAIDRHQFRDGRKLVPWIQRLAPFTAAAAFLLFVNWGMSGAAAKMAYCVGIFLLWDILHSFMNTSLLGLTAAISPSSAQRARTAQWVDIGVMLGAYFPELLLPMLSGSGAFGLTQRKVYLLFAAIMCLGGGALFLSAAAVTERVRAAGAAGKANVFKSFGVLRHNHILLLFLAVDLLRAASPYVNEVFVYQQVSYQAGGRTIPAPVLVVVLTVLAGLPAASLKLAATKIAARVGGMQRVLAIAAVTDVITRVVATLIGIGSIPRLILVYVCDAVSNLPWGIYGMAQRALVSDSVDYVEWKTGQRTEGVTMSARNLTGKLCAGLRRLVIGYCLRFLGYKAENVELGIPQSAHYRKWVWPVYKLGIAGGALLSLIPILLMRYPDSLKRQVESELAERRAML